MNNRVSVRLVGFGFVLAVVALGCDVSIDDEAVGASGESALASTVTLNPVADARAEKLTPDTNFGTAKTLVSDGDPKAQSYLRFVVSGVTGRVTKATLRLYATSGTVDGPQVYSMSGAWSESSVTWNTRPQLSGSALANTSTIAAGTWVTFDVTSLVVGNGTYNLGLIPTSNDGVNFDSREGVNRPQLVLSVEASTAPTPAPTPSPLPAPSPAPAPTPTGACVPPGGASVEYSVKTPPAITLPAAGGSYVDPVFGTKIIRVTDVGNSMHAYSYWPVFNANSTRFFVNRNGTPTLYSLDPATDKIAMLGQPFATSVGCDWQDASWSHSNPNVLFCHTTDTKRLYSYDITTSQYTLIKDLSGGLSASTDAVLYQMLIDKNDNAFAFHTRDASDVRRKAVVFLRGANQVFTRSYDPTAGFDEAHIDKTGTYAVMQIEKAWQVWDFRKNTVISIDYNATERGGSGHQVAGSNLYVGDDGWSTGYQRRTLSDPEHPTHLVTFFKADKTTLNWTFATHASFNHADERFFVSSIYTTETATWDPWEQEILAVATDGSFVKRLAHHHSVITSDYWTQPRASTSYDGRYAAFTSNFDGRSRDVFILKMPVLCQ